MNDKQKNIFAVGGIVCAVALVIALIIVIINGGGASLRNNKEDAKKFKQEYEALNGEVNSSGTVIRSVTIPEDNPFVYTTAEELLKKIDKGETFIVYFGFPNCPWCRSVIEKATEVANKKNIKSIYYINIRNDKNEEILRDKYILGKKNKVEKEEDGAPEYAKLLEKLGSVLPDYTLTTQDGDEIKVGEKRIYAPNFIYVKNGTPLKLEEGVSSKQSSSNQALSDDILKDEEDIFAKFFELTK